MSFLADDGSGGATRDTGGTKSTGTDGSTGSTEDSGNSNSGAISDPPAGTSDSMSGSLTSAVTDNSTGDAFGSLPASDTWTPPNSSAGSWWDSARWLRGRE